MALMLGKLYTALEASTSQELAREAAEEVAAFESRISGMEGTLKAHKWMLGYLVAVTSVMAWKLVELVRATAALNVNVQALSEAVSKLVQ